MLCCVPLDSSKMGKENFLSFENCKISWHKYTFLRISAETLKKLILSGAKEAVPNLVTFDLKFLKNDISGKYPVSIKQESNEILRLSLKRASSASFTLK